jgi:Flp pilus assembly protein TadG
MRLKSARRQGSTVIEFAIVGPVALFLLIGLLVGAMGTFRYQEVAYLARQASRYASVRGTRYATETGQPAASAQDIYNNAIVAQNVGLDLSQLTYSVTWNADNNPSHTQTTTSGQQVTVTNKVRVTITYQWIPEAYLGGITMTSTSETPMSN